MRKTGDQGIYCAQGRWMSKIIMANTLMREALADATRHNKTNSPAQRVEKMAKAAQYARDLADAIEAAMPHPALPASRPKETPK